MMLCGLEGEIIGFDVPRNLFLNSVCVPCYGTHVCVMMM